MKRITAILLALVIVFAIPGSASAHWDAAYRWEGQSQSNYSYWVDVCASGNMASGNNNARLDDARGEWNEIGGELLFNEVITNCSILLGGAGNAVHVYFTPLSGDTLGSTNCNLIWNPGDARYYVDQCTVAIDSDNATTSCGSYTWYTGAGSPGVNEIDLESVLVHELGHALRVGHSSDGEAYIMDNNLSDTGGCPEGVEKDERVYSHDTQAYTQYYGTTH